MTFALREGDRVLITGATGWFGETARCFVPAWVATLCTSSRPQCGCIEFSLDEVKAFAPSVVMNFAFLTREKVDVLGVERFRAINSRLLDEFAASASLPSVRGVVTVSSGAAITAPDHPYGQLKRQEEELALSLVSASRSVSVIRAYSVSGALVRNARAYAFSDMVLQAELGEIPIRSDVLTSRRYVSVQDVLTLSVLEVNSGNSGVVETGGELVEMQDLAERVRDVVNPEATISRPHLVDSSTSVYASDGTSWVEACGRHGYVAASLEQQIADVSRGLRERTAAGEVFD